MKRAAATDCEAGDAERTFGHGNDIIPVDIVDSTEPQLAHSLETPKVADDADTPTPALDEDTTIRDSFRVSVHKSDLSHSSGMKQWLWPLGVTKQAIPMFLCLIALTLTGAGSWDCSFFQGAQISFTGSNYGLWTLRDISGKCQRWDVLFFSYNLGGPLIAGRIFSMASMLLGLSLLTTMAQALQFYAVSWGIGIILLLLSLVSIFTTSIYNVWAVFWLFTYIIFILAARALFIHPIQRRISQRGCKIVAGLFALCSVCTMLTLIVLKSDFCTCDNITSEALKGRSPGDNACDKECEIGSAGILMILAAFVWAATAVAVLRYGVQPDDLESIIERTTDHTIYGYYPRNSITSRLFGYQTTFTGTVAKASAPLVKMATRRSPGPSKGEGSARDEATAQEVAGEDDAIELMEASKRMLIKKENEEIEDKRGYCKRGCCDYRVRDRTRRERWAFWTFRVVLGFLIGIYVFLVAIMVGSRGESTTAAKAPDTSFNFITDIVCAFDPLDLSQPFQTFPKKADANSAGYQVAHCGACAFCSNPADIETYVETRKTIAKQAKKCGKISMLGSYEELVACLDDKIGFTEDCTKCWADNMISTGKQCLFTCMVTMFTGFMSNNNVPGAGDQGWLNQCLFCDEKLSGPAFVTCSGVARRRLGIVSEIERNPDEQCQQTDVDWVSVDFDTLFGDYGLMP